MLKDFYNQYARLQQIAKEHNGCIVIFPKDSNNPSFPRTYLCKSCQTQRKNGLWLLLLGARQLLMRTEDTFRWEDDANSVSFSILEPRAFEIIDGTLDEYQNNK